MPTCVTVPPLTSLMTTAPVPANTRANVPSPSAASLRIRVYDRDGKTLVKDRVYTVPAQGHMQTGLPVEVDQGSIEFFVDDASKQAVVFPYTSTLDRYTNDPMYQTPILLASAKTLFGKRAIEPTSIGRKITLEDAREVRAAMTRLGEVVLP